jgi:hypothetical protein
MPQFKFLKWKFKFTVHGSTGSPLNEVVILKAGRPLLK